MRRKYKREGDSREERTEEQRSGVDSRGELLFKVKVTASAKVISVTSKVYRLFLCPVYEAMILRSFGIKLM